MATDSPIFREVTVPGGSMTFTVDAARALGGPAWLGKRRLPAAERFASTALPTPSEEAWRYSRIDKIDLDRYQPVADGRPTVSAVEDSLRSKGVVVSPFSELSGAPEALGSVAVESPDAFVLLNDAFAVDGTYIYVPDGVVVPDPIVIEHHTKGTGTAYFPRTVVIAGRDSEVSVLERFESPAGDRLVVPVTEMVAGPAGRIRYLGVQDHGADTWQIGLVRAHLARDASLRSSAVALGGGYARLRSEACLSGSGAESEMVAVYFANESQMLDFRTLQDHDAPHTRSDLLFKGAVEDEAQSVYSGMVRIRETASRANASQTNRNLVLSEGAAAKSIPNLEIETDDVRCSHASAVGPIDADQLYYLESRGVPPEAAERLIVFGFFEDVISRLSLVGSGGRAGRDMEGRLRSAVARKFEARRCCHA
jgi:Fe-S cluster assembly protein SufD